MAEHVCPWWLAYTFDNPIRGFFHSPDIMLGPYVEKGSTALDIGCGMGFFSIGLAKLVGETGRVISADIQPRMLETVRKRAARAGVADIIELHRSTPDRLGVSASVDFVLAFWMVHEVPNTVALLDQIGACLKAGGHVLIAEPKYHVTAKRFKELMDIAISAGWKMSPGPKVRFSRTMVLSR